MCEYCKNLEAINEDDGNKALIDLYVDYGVLNYGELYTYLCRDEAGEPCLAVEQTIAAVSGSSYDTALKDFKKINYCPICGRKLK